MKNNIKILFLAFVLFIFPALSQAASLSFAPASGSFSVGQTFSVSVVVGTPDQAMNAVSGVVSFPTDQLQVTSLSKGGSIVGLWVQEPSFSNTAGTVNFEGVALNPGFTGAAGRVLGINFRVRQAGSAQLSFGAPTVLANDGQGTSILRDAGEANFQLKDQNIAPAPVEVGNALVISSPTHPDQDKWYAVSTAKFVWDLPVGARGLRLGIATSPDAFPDLPYDPPVKEKTFPNLADGVWSFSAQYKDANGWSEISHFRVQIDTTAPDHFRLTKVVGQADSETAVKLNFDASDALSGIAHYEINLDGKNLPNWSGSPDNIYETPPLTVGNHSISARAVDRAGNALSASLTLGVAEIPAPGWWQIGAQLVVALSVLVPLLGIIILLAFLLYNSYHRFRLLRRKIRQEVAEAEESIGKAFDLLREDLEKQLSLLEKTKSKRELTREETRILGRIRKNLRLAEKYIKKEVEDIEEKVK